MMSVQ